MEDIQLTADGSQALATLKKIQDSVDNLGVQFKKFATESTKSLDSVKKSTDTLSKATEGLKSALIGLGVAKVAGDFMNYAREVKGASDATGVAISTIDNFAKAVGRAGGDTNRAVGDVIDFTAQLNEAKQGSAGAQAELSQLGITLNDLATQSNEQIFKKTLDSLAAMEDASMRNALAVKYLGRNFKDIDVRAVSKDMGTKDNTQAIQDAAQAMKNMNTVFSGLKQGILQAFAPLFAILAKLGPDTIETFTRIAAQVGTAAVAVTGLAKAFQWVGAVVTFIAGAWASLKVAGAALAAAGVEIAASFGLLRGIISYIIGLVTALWAAMAGTPLSFLSKIGQVFSLIGAEIAAAGGLFLILRQSAMVALTFIWEALVALYKPLTLIVIAFIALREGIKAAFDIDILDEFIKGLSWIWSKIKDIIGLEKEKSKVTAQQADIRKIDNELLKEQAVATSKVVDGQRAIALEAKKTLDAYRQQGLSAARNLGISISLIGVDADRAAQIQKMADLETNYLTEVNNLEQKKIELQRAAAAGTAEDQAALASFMGVYKSTLKGIDDEYASQQERLQSLLNVETVLKAREQERLNALDAITKQMERQALLGDQLRSANDKMVDLKFNAKISPLGNPLEGLQPAENDKAGQTVFARIQKSSRAVQVEYAKIQEDARKAALEAGRAFAAGFEDNGDGLSAEKAEELAKGLDQIAKRYKAIADAQTANLEASQTFAYGWKEAFDAYADSATNAAKKAGDAFSAVTRGMESAIDKFVETGKFSFSDMASSIIRDLIKIEMKAQAMQLWKMLGGASSSGGIGGFLGNIFGGFFADGGQPPMGKASIVGENGPELFVPRSAGTIIPNNQLGGGGQTVVNNYNSYITNTVSALDAKSVAQLFAENKKTLFGVVESARREVPMRG